MAIVINEFEAVAEAPSRSSAGGRAGADADTGAPAEQGPHETAEALHQLAQGALRVWAH